MIVFPRSDEADTPAAARSSTNTLTACRHHHLCYYEKLTAKPFPEGPRLGEKTLRFRRVVARLLVELLQELALAARQVDRRLHRHLNVHVAHLIGAQDGHAFALQAELLA